MEVSAPADFAADTQVEPLETGRYAVEIKDSWSGPPGPNGGYVAALILRAIRASVPEAERSPCSLTIHYLRPPADGPAEVEVEVERSGRTATTCSARLEQGGKVRCLALCVLAEDFESAADWSIPPPEAPPPSEIEPIDSSFMPPRIFEQLEMRMLFGGVPFTGGEGEAGGWLRTRSPAALEPELVAMYTDAWWPAPFPRVQTPFLAPTLDLTIHFRGRPPQGDHEHVLARFTSSTSSRGYFEEDGELWSEDGTLLAQSRQLALARPWKR
ncbi:MAG TPA: thioesterase family protein [Solirubrobacterales bacterium]|nr:thioesterase family protein [Solirubrobacterales bacterium]